MGEREKERIGKEKTKKAREKLGDRKGERGSDEYLMGSGGVY